MTEILGGDNARSAAGHAAFSMRGLDDRWVTIQMNTFCNWVNEQVRSKGLKVEDFQTDFCDGILLCNLLEVLQGKRVGRFIKKPMNQHQYLENVTLSLQAMQRDNIKLVNIGSEDIVNGNLKLILGLIWHMILRYQIGKASKIPPKKLMLSWLNAILYPDNLSVSNFNSDWNDGIALHAIIEYCRPGSCPNWRSLRRSDNLENCRDAMNLAKKHFDIPLVLSPENLSSPDLDELSGMTYLSYFMKVDSPGYHATLSWVNKTIPDSDVRDFQNTWNDGQVLASLIEALGGNVNISNSHDHVRTLQECMDSAKRMGVEPVIPAKEMADTEVDHLGVMAYAAWFQNTSGHSSTPPPPPPPAPPVAFTAPPPPPPPTVIERPRTPSPPPLPPPEKRLMLTQFMRETIPANIAAPTTTDLRQETTFTVEMMDDQVNKNNVHVEVMGPASKPPVTLSWHGTTGHGHFAPIEPGNHQLMIYHDGVLISGCPKEVVVTGPPPPPKPQPVSINLLTRPPAFNPLGIAMPLRINASQAGNVHVEARSPSGRMQDMSVQENGGVFTANFTPTEVGDWMISILYEGVNIQGSPFNVRVYDAAQVKVFGLEGGSVGKTFAFRVDCSEAGDGELLIDIKHNGITIPADVVEDGISRGCYRVAFTPEGAGIYTIVVRFAGVEVTGSPYTLEIVDSSKVTASGEGISGPVEVGKITSFIVDTHGASGGNIDVKVTSPQRHHVNANVRQLAKDQYRVEYMPAEVGEHTVSILYYGKPIHGSPHQVQSIDWSRITLRNLRPSGVVGRLVEFDIDTANAGSGNLEIMVNDGTIPCSVQNRGNRQFHASFTPKDASPHYIQMKFNGREVPGSPWRVDIRGATSVTVKGAGLTLAQVNRHSMIELVASGGYSEGNVEAHAQGPSGRPVPVNVSHTGGGHYLIDYVPYEVGTHQINVMFDGQIVNGSPFTVKSYDASSIHVSEIQPGSIGRPVEFTIDVTQAGEGQLEIMVNQGAVPNTVKMLRKGVFLVSFVPRDPNPHSVDIRFNQEPLPICPITVPVLDASRVTVQGGLENVAVNRYSSFRVNTASAGEADLNVRVTSPSGKNVPIKLTANSQYGFDGEYRLSEVGTHQLDVKFGGLPVTGSPFYIKAYDADRVGVQGVQDGIVGQKSEFTVDVTQAGEGNLEISIVGGGRNIQNHVRQIGPGKFEVSYNPQEGIDHQAMVTFNGEHVRGSPFPFQVTDIGKVCASGDGLTSVPVGRPAQFIITGPGIRGADFDIRVNAPDRKLCQHRLTDKPNGQVVGEYTPKVVGDHMVEILYQGVPINGSPFKTRVWDARNVFVSNLNQGRIKKPNNFNVDASQAGAGNLEIVVTVAGETLPNFVKSQGNANFEVSFTPKIADTHMISIKFNGETIPGSPFMVDISDPGKVHSLEWGAIRVPIGKRAVVNIDPRRAGALAESCIVEVIAPSNEMIRGRVQAGDKGLLKAEFVPKEVGPHVLNVTLADVELPGSPFACEVYDIQQVKMSRMQRGIIGKPYELEIDASRAGVGDVEVVVKTENLNKRLPVKIIDKGNRHYKAYFMPKDPIIHHVFAMFGKESVPGSPFQINVEDSTQVIAAGRCLEASPVNQRAEFTIDPSRAPFRAGVFVKILTPPPEKVPVPFNIIGNYLDGWHVSWRPNQLGVHTVEVKYGDSHVVGSPFRCRVYDLSKVMILRDESMQGVDMDGIPGEDIVFFVDASEAGAGNLEVIVRSTKNNMRIPNFLEAADRSGKFRIYFTPRDHCYRYQVEVLFNDEQIIGSPFYCSVIDGSKVTASGDGLGAVPASKPTHFMVHTSAVGPADITVDITSPDRAQIPVNISGTWERDFHVAYTPTVVGPHLITIKYADIDIAGSPFTPQVYDANAVKVSNIPQGIIDQPVTFEVDCSRAGEGTMKVDIRGRSTSPHPEIVSLGNGLFEVTFIPKESVPHTIMITYNNQKVPGSSFKTQVVDLACMSINWEQLNIAPVNRSVPFDLQTGGVMDVPVEIFVNDPHGHNLPVHMVPAVNKYRIDFKPTAVGPHIITVTAGGMMLKGSPHTLHVYDTSRVYLDNVTMKGKIGEEMGFTVDTTEAGQGDIDIEIMRADGQPVRPVHHPINNTHHHFSFIPQVAMEHIINVMFNNEQVPGVPLTVQVTDPFAVLVIRDAKEFVLIDDTASFIIGTQGARIDPNDLLIQIQAPNGDRVPAKLKQQPDGDYKVEYSSKYTGRHTVEILYAGQAIMGSPFYVEIYDPNKIRVEGMKGGLVGEKITFEIIRNEAGKAELSVSIHSPSGRTVPFDMSVTGRGERVTYVPEEVGPHQIYIHYGGLEVPGCPMNQVVQDGGTAFARGEGLHRGEEDKPAAFVIDTKGKHGDLSVVVEGPNSLAKCNIEPDHTGGYIVTYIPVEVGTFNIKVKWNNREIQGSPFQARVVDSRKVRPVGEWSDYIDANNNMALMLNETKIIRLDATEAGPGEVSAELRGPAGMIPVNVFSNSRNMWTVEFTPKQEGEYHLHLKYADVNLPRSPFRGSVKSAMPPPPAPSQSINHDKVVLTGRGLQEAKVNEEAEFVIDGTLAGPGNPTVKLTGIKCDIETMCQPLGGNKYRVTYVPKLPGAYLLTIMWSDRQVQGSPFKVNVPSHSDATKVICTGDGLKAGIMGREIKSIIDTRRAGPGELTAHCAGPHKIAYCELFDHRDGTFTLNVQPQEAGRHVLNIKFDGEHVTGSPYILRVSGAPDASKVRVYGPGVEHGILAQYQSRFIVDTRGAGAGQLTVRIRGPKGAFRVEMQRESQKDRTILCRYDPCEIGDYVVHVKWSGEHVPNSPFHVHICDTQEELERVAQDNGPSGFRQGFGGDRRGDMSTMGSSRIGEASMNFNTWQH